MKKTLIGLLGSTVICVLFLAGCIDEHYGEDSNTIVTNLTGYASVSYTHLTLPTNREV